MLFIYRMFNNSKNQIEPKMKYYNDTLQPTPFLPENKSVSLPDTNQSSRITNINLTNTRKDKYDISGILLDRQFASVLRGSELESNLLHPQDCNVTDRTYNLDNIKGINENTSDMLNKSDMLNTSYGLLLDEVSYLELSKKFNVSCSERRRDLNWADYRAPPQQTTGRGFGNPDKYNQTYVGINSRNDNQLENPRDIDLQDRNVIPKEVFKINYANVPYDHDLRGGVSTRTYKKAQTNYNLNN